VQEHVLNQKLEIRAGVLIVWVRKEPVSAVDNFSLDNVIVALRGGEGAGSCFLK
jgi:hypothetical protein